MLDLFSIGLGPSSSHTVGPMKAGADFARYLTTHQLLSQVYRITVDTFGSLAATGEGHGTFGAILLGLENHHPQDIDPTFAAQRIKDINTSGIIYCAGQLPLPFSSDKIGKFPFTIKDHHPNALTITAFDAQDHVIHTQEYYSIGGGNIEYGDQSDASTNSVNYVSQQGNTGITDQAVLSIPYPFSTATELLDLTRTLSCSISDIVWRNELTMHDSEALYSGILQRWSVMFNCIERGLRTEGQLPGGLHVIRRAPGLFQQISHNIQKGKKPDAMDWLNLAAIAVNEENAAGGRIVTAPTNGAAGVFPAVLYYALREKRWNSLEEKNQSIIRFFLTATAIGHIIKSNASISGAEIGCQGEVGAACAMTAAAYADMAGCTAAQVENAAEIAIEHNLGLTCDPIMGLVQIPCIERNAVGAVKAVNAARLASYGDGTHRVSLDKVIETLRLTGLDMNVKYKETALGGLATTVVPVNVIEC